MFTRILVPLDGSARAEQALPVAARIARSSNAKLLLMQAVDISMQIGLSAEASFQLETLIESKSDAAKLYLAERASANDMRDLPTETAVVVGAAAESILSAIEAQHADLVVMCGHGRTGIGRWALGSVAEHVARHAFMPVLVLRESGTFFATPDTTSESTVRAMVTLDGSKYAEAALEPAADLVLSLSTLGHAALHLALVAPLYEASPSSTAQELLVEGAKSYLSQTAQQTLEAHPQLQITWSVSTQMDVAQSLVALAESGEGAGASAKPPSDLIAMATHGASGIARWAMGSITDRVLHATKLPVLIVRPRELAEQQKPH